MNSEHQIDVTIQRDVGETWQWRCVCGIFSSRMHVRLIDAEQEARQHFADVGTNKDFAFTLRPKTASDEVCDFCSDHVTDLWVYPTNDFRMKLYTLLPRMESIGFWTACAVCHDLIETGKQLQLLRRSMEKFGKETSGEVRILLHIAVQNLHADFFSHRDGAAVRRLRPQGTT